MRDFILFSVILAQMVSGLQLDTQSCDSSVAYDYFKLGNKGCDCNAKSAGQMKFERGKLLVCAGGQWKAIQYEQPLGSREYPGLSCQDIRHNRKGARSGIYWITLNGPFLVYCNMARRDPGWTLVFKAVSGVDKNIYHTYNSDDTSSESVKKALDRSNRYPDHYKNRIVNNWATFDPSEARVVLFKAGKAVKELKFDARGTDKLNWFDVSRLTKSSWGDIKTEPRNFFSIGGGDGRHFFINRNYEGCPADAGWLATTSVHCDWEKRYPLNTILFSKLATYSNWNHHDDVDVADVLAVFLR